MRMLVFKAMLKEKGITDEIAAALSGISLSTLRRRLKNGSFRAKEIARISRALGLSNSEICYIFFETEVAQRKQMLGNKGNIQKSRMEENV